jgi:hypothetical protein
MHLVGVAEMVALDTSKYAVVVLDQYPHHGRKHINEPAEGFKSVDGSCLPGLSQDYHVIGDSLSVGEVNLIHQTSNPSTPSVYENFDYSTIVDAILCVHLRFTMQAETVYDVD